MKDAKKLYGMELHEEFHVHSRLSVIRVPGGWIYAGKQTTVFIPYNPEFKEPKSGGSSVL